MKTQPTLLNEYGIAADWYAELIAKGFNTPAIRVTPDYVVVAAYKQRQHYHATADVNHGVHKAAVVRAVAKIIKEATRNPI